VETLEHWWNGRWGSLGRRDIYLRRNPAGLWEIEARELGRSALGEFTTEGRAREVLGPLVAADGWRRVDHLNAPRQA
jgi:hypothetical protein